MRATLIGVFVTGVLLAGALTGLADQPPMGWRPRRVHAAASDRARSAPALGL